MPSGQVTFRVADAGGGTASRAGTYSIRSSTRDLVAVAAFPSYTGATYSDHAAVIAKMQALGVRNVRHQWLPSMSAAVKTFVNTCDAAGIKTWFTVGKPRVAFTAAQWTAFKTAMKGPMRGKVTRVFTFNEPNSIRNPDDPPLTNWVRLTIDEARALKAAVDEINADYDLDGTPHIRVAMPGLWSGDIDQQFADLQALVTGYVNAQGVRVTILGTYDDIAWHLYMRPKNGSFDVSLLTNQEAQFRAILGDQTSPIVCTEAGYFTAPNYVGGSNPVTEAQQAVLIPQLINWYASRGYGLCYFELLDDVDPGGTKREASFGVVRCPSLNSSTWTDKPAFETTRLTLAA